MTRLPLIGVDRAVDRTAEEIFGEIRAVRGEVTNLFRVVANDPTLLRDFFQLSRRVRDESTLPPHISELAILSTVFAIGSRYEIAQHVIQAERVGISVDHVARLRAGDLASFPLLERSVIAYARQVTVDRDVDDSTFRELVGLLGEARTMELAVLVGWYHLVAAIVEPLQLAIEPEKLAEPALARLDNGNGDAWAPST